LPLIDKNLSPSAICPGGSPSHQGLFLPHVSNLFLDELSEILEAMC
jgi:hypothetical protein